MVICLEEYNKIVYCGNFKYNLSLQRTAGGEPQSPRFARQPLSSTVIRENLKSIL